MRFPSEKFSSVGSYFNAYVDELARASASVSRDNLIAAEALLTAALKQDAQVFACGNGGSAAISNHLVCDHAKGVQADTSLRPRIRSLSENVELITAIGNDISYDKVFAFQLSTFARPGDVLITISSSGNSENIVRAIRWALDNQMATIAMTGFDGGRSARLSQVNLHVVSENYGVIEDLHQSLMHTLAQYIRQSYMSEELIKSRKF
jgi:phosphoheptose isomerase